MYSRPCKEAFIHGLQLNRECRKEAVSSLWKGEQLELLQSFALDAIQKALELRKLHPMEFNKTVFQSTTYIKRSRRGGQVVFKQASKSSLNYHKAWFAR